MYILAVVVVPSVVFIPSEECKNLFPPNESLQRTGDAADVPVVVPHQVLLQVPVHQHASHCHLPKGVSGGQRS